MRLNTLIGASKGVAIAGSILLLIVPLSACTATHKMASHSQQAQVRKQEESTENANSPEEVQENASVPKVLSNIGETAEDAYDDAKSEDWKKLQKKLGTLQQAETDLRTQKLATAADSQTISTETNQLSQAVQKKDSVQAMQAANQMTAFAIDQSKEYKQPVPSDVARLDYYGRELEIGVAEKNQTKLEQTRSAITKTWQQLQPTVQAKNGQQEAKRFQNLVDQLGQSKSLDTYNQLASAILEEVDRLESVFTK